MKLTQAILPVAGLGTRFLPWTKSVPKELLPVGNKPVIALLVDECLSVGIKDICFVISRGKESIPQFFYEDNELEEELERRGKKDLLSDLKRYNEVNFHVVYQEEQLGDGHAILQAADWVDSENVAVLFGDDLIVSDAGNGLQQMVQADRGPRTAVRKVMMSLQDVPKEDVSRYGIVEVKQSQGRLKEITSLVEKPTPEEAPSTLAIVGKFILPKSIFDVLPDVGAGHGGEIRLVDALISELGKTPIYGHVFEGKRFDVGTPEGYKETVQILG
ncbi:NTP transferase domain-containing protein [Candidatus Peribacteria bacterium]|nr:NTP transferase domain-containing protein [Candidatus Peribacteria bacterium]MBT4020966.1 NTP transferase domain-containing protein [Candidatus Peribacteria bacterium]MBT4240316.1 NTP transferase domain-containing protein [Candidatus Peribacteria bacterium]MBT4474086.1 NTP transferase domain-containing protein [Candidatus Peribacteria bacterium]